MNLLRRAAEAVLSLAVVVMFAGLLGQPDADQILLVEQTA
jgi:hypothetical protein